MPTVSTVAVMNAEQALDGMTREQLISLLDSILRRLFAPTQTGHPTGAPRPAETEVEGQLVIDPTIDASKHTGFFPQGFHPSPPRGGGCLENVQTRPMPQFGCPSVNSIPSATSSSGTFIGAPLYCLQQAVATRLSCSCAGAGSSASDN